jgi:hypothetical protein
VSLDSAYLSLQLLDVVKVVGNLLAAGDMVDVAVLRHIFVAGYMMAVDVDLYCF